MPRISGVTIPAEKRIEVSLTYIYGIGPTKSKQLLTEAGISPDIRAGKLTEAELEKIRTLLDKSHRVEGDLRREISSNIKRLREIGSYIGIRHAKGLPVRGQKTKTNSRTRRGGKKNTMSSGKRGAPSKT